MSAGSRRAASCTSRASSRRSTRAVKAEPSFEPRASHPLLHPGKSAITDAGILGELHPRELDGEWGVFELDLRSLFDAAGGPVIYHDVITYPAIRQDIAVSVPEETAAGDLVSAAREAAGPELREIRVFDVYRGEQVGAGRKSVAFSVAFQAPSRTLTEEDATRLRDAIVNALGERFGAELRAPNGRAGRRSASSRRAQPRGRSRRRPRRRARGLHLTFARSARPTRGEEPTRQVVTLVCGRDG